MPPPIVYTKSVISKQWKEKVTHEVVTSAEATLKSNNMTGGSGPDGSIYPPGWGSGVCPTHHNRGHLIGNKLGGPGNIADNLVTLTAGTNHPFMYEFEDAVYCYVTANPGVNFVYRVACDYDSYTKHPDFPIPGASSNPFCLFPAPAALTLSLIGNGKAITLGELTSALPKPPTNLGPAAVYTSLLIWNGGYKLYTGASHTANACWSVIPDSKSLTIQTHADEYAKLLKHVK